MAALGATHYVSMEQVLEGARVADFMWGTSNAKQMVISFDYTGSGVDEYFAIAVRNGTYNRSFVAECLHQSIGGSSSVSSHTVIIPGDTGGTWATDSTAGISISLVIGAGTNFQTTPGTWVAGNYIGTANVGISPKTGQSKNLTKLGVYLDYYKTGVAPPYVLPDLATELRRCQRYWQKMQTLRGSVTAATTVGRAGAPLTVPMAFTPAAAVVGTPNLWDGSTGTTVSTIASNQSNEFAAEFNFTNPSVWTVVGRACVQYYVAETSYIALSARY